ncbi:MAG: hypothetical protein GF355_00525 [Candidatus Eisenbacteria bacterium]|nr:hypothetical protein [Candidatus Eisenbacteria bacterium]
MKTLAILTAAAAVLTTAGPLSRASAELVTPAEARLAAENYLQMTVAREGSWGDHAGARIRTVAPFVRHDRTLGYFCPVEPEGYLIVSLYHEMAPVRAYSPGPDLDPAAETGMAELLKDRLEMHLASIRDALGRDPSPAEDFSAIMPKSFRSAWATLLDPAFDPARYRRAEKVRSPGMDYQEGETLIETVWHQRPPYNDQCPDDGCSWPGYGYYNTNVRVGCGGVAGAQILRYYNWPPYGEGSHYGVAYDWPNMGAEYIWDDPLGDFLVRWPDSGYSPATQEQIDAVALISRKIGLAMQTDYGCGGSSVYDDNVAPAFEDYFFMYEGIEYKRAEDYTVDEYWQRLKAEFNINRPVFYGITNHFIVGDGWREDDIGGDVVYMIHVEYGWAGTNNGWWPLQEIPESSWSDERFWRYIAPEPIVGTLDGIYGFDPLFPYRYFYKDLSGFSAEFMAGQYLQVLKSGFLLTNEGVTAMDNIIFRGSPPDRATLLYLSGDPEGESRIRVDDGALKILAGGQMAIY